MSYVLRTILLSSDLKPSSVLDLFFFLLLFSSCFLSEFSAFAPSGHSLSRSLVVLHSNIYMQGTEKRVRFS